MSATTSRNLYCLTNFSSLKLNQAQRVHDPDTRDDKHEHQILFLNLSLK